MRLTRSVCFAHTPHGSYAGNLTRSRRRHVGFGATLFLGTLAAGLPTGASALTSPPLVKAALVIGNAHYASVGVLKNPENDARDLCQALSSINFKTLCATDVSTRAKFRSLVEDFIESLPANSVVVIYYAGHGVQVNGENYLLPTTVSAPDERELIRQSVDLSFLFNQLEQSQAYLNVVILDACRSNPLGASGTAIRSGLAQLSSTTLPKSTEVLYASAANEPALDGPDRNGILTKHLLADITQLGDVEDLFKQVSSDVQHETELLGHRQEPARYTNFTDHYCLVRCTDLQVLQQQQLESEEKIQGLQARVEAGDESARAELAKEKSLNAKLQKNAKSAEEKEKQAKRLTSVVPAF
jgi:Caspase domain